MSSRNEKLQRSKKEKILKNKKVTQKQRKKNGKLNKEIHTNNSIKIY